MHKRFIALTLLGGYVMAVGCVPKQEGANAPPPPAAGDSTQIQDETAGKPTGGGPIPPNINAGVCPTKSVLDDAEDGDHQAYKDDQRGGYWYTYSDKAGTVVEPAGEFKMSQGGPDGSKWAAKMSGKTGPGGILYAGVGFSITDPKAPVDLSCCKGVSFYAKKAGAGIAAVRLKVPDAQTTPEGNQCKQCYNDFGRDYMFTDQWTKYELPFAEMSQEASWGDKFPAIMPTHIYGLQWQVKDPNQSFEIWVDSVELIGCGG